MAWRAVRVQPYLAATTRLAIQDAEIETWERPVDVLAGTRVPVGGRALVDVWGGRGVLRGAGSTAWRLGLAVRIRRGSRPEREEAPPPSPVVMEEDDALPEASEEREERVVSIDMPLVPDEVEVPPVGPSTPDEAHAELPSILLETLRFEVDTTELHPESVPVLERLTADLLSHPSVGPILLEGHASEEGDHLYNYDLSLARADAIYKHLVVAGVQPRRLVLRGLGEVAGEEERILEQRRRVEVRWILDSYMDAADVPDPFSHEVDP